MEQLAWLPIHPDFAGALKAARLVADPEEKLSRLVELANYRRNFVATEKLDRTAAQHLSSAPNLLSALQLRQARLAVLSSHTVDHLVPAIRIAGLGRRTTLSTHVGPYGLYRQALLDSNPDLVAFAPQFLLLALDARDYTSDIALSASEAEVTEAIVKHIDELRVLWRAGRERYAAQVIQQTFVASSPTLFGSYDGLVPASPGAFVERLNDAVRSAAREEGVLLLDVAWLGRRWGNEAIGDPVRWHQAKQLVAPHFAPQYGDWVARIIAASLGLSRKCLVLDLDNTIWGGVVGDDGVEGIRLGQGDPLGEAYLEFQRYVAALGKRGIALAICSKNDPATAEAAFSEHPEMVLHRTDIASFVANWDDKASNLRRIAQELGLGLDSFVFVDDNPAERHIVRRELPMVAVPELPDDVANYPGSLADAGYFEAASFTSDDVMRARAYQANVERQAVLARTTDMEGYLKNLSMTLIASEIRPVDLPRASQLINKSNQFNLTTRRYTEAELQRLVDDPAILAMCFRLKDRFGDNGLISVILARPDVHWGKNAFLIDTWLMSCRVLGRQVEAAALEVLANEAANRGAQSLIGEYRPTPRNGLVSDHYAKLGFAPASAPRDESNSASFWRFDIQTPPPRHFITVERLS
ncbi:HAD-IIIC family phosphatase [Dongia deserti]|uniref:HAD-IIIC family phosphatase n=1 Tax=Dongia deserti TaxID=2268030 RepID=UPI000E65368F|nr:HAD-IIIC family phosphatase [Dongia deserti]